jgi:PIN domain nuclease of toxin-antitoxin system
MRLLLDANIVLWALERPERLNPAVLATVLDSANELFVSTATLLEITSKAASGRLTFDDESHAKVIALAAWLSVEANHAWRVRSLPPIHKDPFDRIIVAQALEEGMTLVTGDHLLAEYGVPILLT